MMSRVRKSLLLMPFECEAKDITLVEDSLYVGNKEFAHNYHSMKTYDISLIIAVYPKGLTGLSLQMIPQNCRFHNIDANDSPNEDLISHFDQCFDLISEELVQNEGKVLVYCGAGFSRSVTIVCSYLMKKYRIGADEAVERVRRLRTRINPNPGFLAQLRLYEHMGYELDASNPEYRVLALIRLKKQIWTEKYWEDSPIGALNRQFCDPMQMYFHKLSKTSNIHTSHINKSMIYYLCRKCDYILFEEINVLINVENRDQIEDTVLCDQIFIEPIKWMLPLICNKQKSDIQCPNCAEVLGAFRWRAFKCQCLLHNRLQDSTVFRIKKSSVVKHWE